MFAQAQQQHSEFLTQLLERLMTDEETCYEEEKHFLVLDLKTSLAAFRVTFCV